MTEQEFLRLRISDSEDVVRTIKLEKFPVTIGRQGGNDVVFHDPCVSRQHAQILLENGDYHLRDLGSKGGTYVNGERIEDHILVHGDSINFGKNNYPLLHFLMRDDPATDLPSKQDTQSLHWSLAGMDMVNVSRLLESSRYMSAGLPLSDILDLVLDMAIEVTGAERGVLMMTQDQDEFRVERARDNRKKPLPIGSFRISQSVLKRVVQSASKVMLMDNQSDDALQSDSVADLDLRTIVCLPLRSFEIRESFATMMSRPKIIGAIYLDSKSASDKFSRISEQILDTIAADAASVIENARLLKESKEKERLQAELSTAREIQAAILPEIREKYEFFEVYTHSTPSRQIGGDCYDLIPLKDGSYGFSIADVAGKGIPAAILGAMVEGVLWAEAKMHPSLATCIASLNDYLVEKTKSNRFVTMFYCTLQPNGELRFVCAGHNPPLILRAADQKIEELSTAGMALGLFAGAQYEEKSTQLEKDDVLCLFTDGATEATSPTKDLFGEERLKALLSANADRGLREIIEEIVDAITTHTAGAPPSDDLTLFLIRYKGPGATR